MNAPVTIAATIRGRVALQELREMLEQLAVIHGDIADLNSWESKSGPILDAPFKITYEEMHDLLQRRRDAVVLKLENKGLKIAPDPFPVSAPTPEVEQPA